MQLINGNNIDILKQYPDNYFDSIVTDPPYGLGKEPNAEQLMKDWIEKGYHEVFGSGFMGKEWDAFVPQPIFWKEVFRVLKPGGHVVSFFGTRTYDWGVMAMRFAGFEVRDCIQWLYGSGFPKSHNVGKSVDKIQGNEREFVRTTKTNGIKAITKSRVEQGYRKNLTIANSRDERVLDKGNSEWEGFGSALKPANEPIVLARKPLEKGLSIAENVLKWGTGAINIDGCRVGFKNEADFKSATFGVQTDIRGGNFNNNRPSDGNILNKNVEANTQGRFPANLILTHHPECECVGTKKVKSDAHHTTKYNSNETLYKGGWKDGEDMGNKFADENGEETIEDWNCHQDCPIKILDQQSGESKSSNTKRNRNTIGSFGMPNDITPEYADKGGASRFFQQCNFEENDFFRFQYTAKASKSERNKGLEKEKWFYNLELITESCSFTEQNLFIWEQEEQNQSMDLNMEVQPKKDILEGTALLVSDKECCTTLNGKSITALFPMAIKFTTKTGLSQTIELKTLNYYQHLNTSDCIVDVLETNKENGLNLAENVGLKNILKLIFTKDKMGFPLGVKIVAKKTQQLTNVKDVWQKNNIHSTVKPVKLMQYLVRLVTPPNGIVLDPFCGSGTTGIACKLEGFDFIGLEQDAEYCKIAQARIDNYIEEKVKKSSKPKEDNNLQPTLF